MNKMAFSSSSHRSSMEKETQGGKAPRYRIPIISTGYDETDGIPENLPYSKFDVCITILTIVCFYLDVATDLGLAFSYLTRSRYFWFGITLAFIVVPSITNSILNLYFYYRDYTEEKNFKSKDPNLDSSAKLWLLRTVFTVLQMGPVIRNFESLRYGIMSQMASNSEQRKYYYTWMLREDADACMLRLFECFMESAPQLTLQLYILVVDTADVANPLRIASLISSWISICWSLASYHRALRFTQQSKLNMSVCATIVYFLWRMLEVGPRIVIIAMFITQYHYWIAVPLSLHWLFVYIWLQMQQLTFCENATWQIFFNMICAFVSIFCFLNVKDGMSRYRCMLFYAVFYAENIVLFSLWFRFTDHMGAWYHLTAFFFVLCGAVLQAILFSCYYCCCHPGSRPLIICKEYDSNEMFSSLCFSIPITHTNEAEQKKPVPTDITTNGEKQVKKQKLDRVTRNVSHNQTPTPTISERYLAMARSGHSLDGDVSSYPSSSTDTRTYMDSVSNTSSKKTETNV